MKIIFRLSFIAMLILLVQACGNHPEKQFEPESKSEIIQISSGSQFGMCMGYCYNESVFKEGTQTKIQRAWRDTIANPEKITNTDLKDSDWNKLQGSVKLLEFYALPEVIGCPDCADGGAGWIEIKTGEKTHRVTFEFGNVPTELAALVGEVKRLNKQDH